MRRLALCALRSCLLACLLGRAAFAATPAAGAPGAAFAGRTVDAILADVVKAMGSEAAWKGHKTLRMKLEMTFQGMGISGTGERFATKDDKALTVTDLPG